MGQIEYDEKFKDGAVMETFEETELIIDREKHGSYKLFSEESKESELSERISETQEDEAAANLRDENTRYLQANEVDWRSGNHNGILPEGIWKRLVTATGNIYHVQIQ
ncbi:4632_t:CDS:2 [Diversispora eburnea]|uniref:4632_t:CDS:1 n=1 Tax=Diversispora eburnea TaxID=1213867 RepID=A0A9N8Z833_9GLOM|nr:4632_t:CDS:2 [Diversispora eburnea]